MAEPQTLENLTEMLDSIDQGREISPPVEPAETQTADQVPDASESEQQATAEPDTQDAEVSALTLADLSESAGIPVEQLYERLTIPLGDNGQLTLGEFKDRAGDLQRVDKLNTDLRQNQARFETDMQQIRGNLSVLAQRMRPDMLTEQDQQAIAQAVQLDNDYREEATLRIIPEWSDSTAKKADIKVMSELLERWGGQASDIDGMSPFYRNMIRHFAKQEQKIAAIKPQNRQRGKLQRPGRQAANTSDDASMISGKVKGGKMSQEEGIARLSKLLG